MSEPDILDKPKPKLMNVQATRAYILSFASVQRPKFKRVSLDFLLRIEAQLKGYIQNEVQRHPSIGITLK